MKVSKIGHGMHVFHFTQKGIIVHKVDDVPIDCTNWVEPGGLGPFLIYGHDANDVRIESLYSLPEGEWDRRIKEIEAMP